MGEVWRLGRLSSALVVAWRIGMALPPLPTCRGMETSCAHLALGGSLSSRAVPQPSLRGLALLLVVQKLARSFLSGETALNIGIHSTCSWEGRVQHPPGLHVGPAWRGRALMTVFSELHFFETP